MVEPMAKGRFFLTTASRNFDDESTERIDTVCGSRLGTSIPTVPAPGMGAMMRMPKAERLRAISFSKRCICAMRTPSAGTTS